MRFDSDLTQISGQKKSWVKPLVQDGGSHHQLRALATGARLRPELAGRRSPVGDGGDEEEGGGVFQHQDFYSSIEAFSGTWGTLGQMPRTWRL